MIYPALKGEMSQKKITLAMIAADPRVDCTVSTLSQKFNGKYPLTFGEAVAIKDIVQSDLSLEELFREGNNDAH